MIKKATVCILCIMMAFSASVTAESVQNGQNADAEIQQQTMPENGERPEGGRGGMGGGRMQPPDGAPPQMPEGGEMPQRPGDETSDAFNAEMPQRPDSETNGELSGEMPQRPDSETNGELSGEMPQKPDGETNGDMPQPPGDEAVRQPAGETSANTQGESASTGFLKEYQTPIISVVLLALAFVFVIFYKKKNY